MPLMEPTIVKHELWLNNELISQWVKSWNRPNSFHARYHIMFDSAYYAGGNGNGPITVKLKVWEAGDTVPQENSYTVQAINNAIIANRNEWEVKRIFWDEGTTQWYSYTGSHFFDAVEDDFLGIKRPVTAISHFRWDAADVLDVLGGKNMLIWASHGHGGEPGNFPVNPPRVYSGTDDLSGQAPSGPPHYGPGFTMERVNGYRPIPPAKYEDTGEVVDWVRLRTWRINQMGTGLPPFNTTATPPVNVGLFVVCDAGAQGSNDPGLSGDLLYPSGNVYVGISSFPENQAVVIPESAVLINQIRVRTNQFMNRLEAGDTVAEAVIHFEQEYDGVSATASVFGDPHTRVRFVYMGAQNGAPVMWRSLQ